MKPSLYLINGPLGAGKTTLLKRMLRSERFADARVIENEFASTSIDSEQLQQHIAEVKTIAGTCVCCSNDQELTSVLEEFAEQSDRPIIIEATGVANSLTLLEKLSAANLLDYYDLRHAVFVLDAAEAHRKPDILNEFRAELKGTDTVAISKTDLLEPEDMYDVMEHLISIREGRIENMLFGELDLDVLEQPSSIVKYHLNHETATHRHDDLLDYVILPTTTAVLSPERLHAVWPRIVTKYGAERIKGALAYEGTVWHVDATPSQCRITPSAVPGETLNLVVIGTEVTRMTEADLK